VAGSAFTSGAGAFLWEVIAWTIAKTPSNAPRPAAHPAASDTRASKAISVAKVLWPGICVAAAATALGRPVSLSSVYCGRSNTRPLNWSEGGADGVGVALEMDDAAVGGVRLGIGVGADKSAEFFVGVASSACVTGRIAPPSVVSDTFLVGSFEKDPASIGSITGTCASLATAAKPAPPFSCGSASGSRWAGAGKVSWDIHSRI
jgi:hypothetical protein